ncbi:MAG: hypothetical protein PWP23_1458 [Candidatus Sumerlaeota bacterium]|nr:hypothetical protein [Candidatus Sumerlaeota bacterium]
MTCHAQSTSCRPASRPVCRIASRILLLGAVLFTLMGATCKREAQLPKVMVPEEDTAREQFFVADIQFQEARGIYDQKKREEELLKAIVAYQAVEKRFPDDKRYTPAAAAIVGSIYQELKQNEKALAQFEHCLQKYPEDDQVRITALMGMGQTWDNMKQPPKAQPYYKMITDEYSTSSDPKVKELVEQARLRYRQIRLIGD